jgi:PAS domain S-box-containing protein
MDPSPKTLLLVEDEAIIALAEARTLNTAGYLVIHASSGEEAISVMNGALGSTIDLILMDIDLGEGIDGTEAAYEILKRHDIPIIFLSSHSDPKTIEKTERITNYGYVVKNLGHTMMFAAIRMAFKLHTAQAKIREREEWIRDLIDKIEDGLCILDEKDRILYVNSALAGVFGVEHGRLVGLPLYTMVGEKTLETVRTNLQLSDVRPIGETSLTVEGADGIARALQLKIIQDYDMKRQLRGSLVTARLQTSLSVAGTLAGDMGTVRSSKTQDVYVHELLHRIKNSLNIIVSLLSLEAQRVSDESARRMLILTETRIRSISLLYDFLSHSTGEDRIDSVEYIQELSRLLKETYSGPDSRIEFITTVDPFSLSSKTCMSIGLMVNELINNALKYGFPRGREGTIRIELRNEADTMILRVRDDGVGLPSDYFPNENLGFGLHLVKTLASQLNGTMNLVSDRGVCVTITARTPQEATDAGGQGIPKVVASA